jgi:hypothetical protein
MKQMKNSIQLNGGRLAVLQTKRRIMPPKRTIIVPLRVSKPDPDLSIPERGATGPVPIGEMLTPLQRIIRHPNRSRLMAEFCKQNSIF